MRPLSLVFGLTAALSLHREASAQEVVARVPALAGRPAMAVAFDGEDVVAGTCPKGPCDPAQGARVPVPADLHTGVPDATLRIVRVGRGRGVSVVVPSPDPNQSFEVVVVPSRSGPKVVFAGLTGFIEGIEGERVGARVEARDGTVYVGEQKEHRTLCGRPMMLAPRALHPEKLELVPAKLQRLSERERASAPRLTAVATDDALGATGILRPIWATSAVDGRLPGALSDGDPETVWSEGRGGVGRGEAIVMQSAREVSIDGFALVVRPPTAEVDGVSPKAFWVATDDDLFRVELPEDGFAHAGRRYRVDLPQPIHTGCVAVVMESAYRDAEDVRVSLAELGATTTLGKLPPEQLVGELDGEPDAAEAAGALLRSGGPPAFEAVARGFEGLGERGRRIALDVLDHAPCEISAPTYVAALTGLHAAHRPSAREGVRRCGEHSAGALAEALETAKGKRKAVVVTELAHAAPVRAVHALGERLAKASPPDRRAYRVGLSLAGRTDGGRAAFSELLARPELDPVAAVDLLRALGSRGAEVGSVVARAFQRLAQRPDFRTRYLLVGVAANLEKALPPARAYLQEALSSASDPHVRAAAVRAIQDPAPYRAELLRALSDSEVRVREAAVQTLSEATDVAAEDALAARVQSDPWPMIRGAAALALGRMGQRNAIDEVLAEALSDPSPHVRRPAVLALGRRAAKPFAEDVKERLADGEEDPAVRAAAALSLGMMCYRQSTDALTAHALRLRDPHADAAARAIGRSAVAALGVLRPADLEQRIAPLLGTDVPSVYRAAARQALGSRRICRPTKKS